MRVQHLSRIYLVLACGLALAACAARRAPPAGPTAAPVVLETASPFPATATPGEPTVSPATQHVSPTPEAYLQVASPSPIPPDPFFLGVPAGDLYMPSGLVVDSARSRAYVFGALRPGDRPALSTVDLTAREVVHVTPLPGLDPAVDGRVLVSPAGDRLYVVDRESATLTLVNLVNGALVVSLKGITDAALSLDGNILYTVGDGVRAYDTASLGAESKRPQWETPDAGFGQVAINGGLLAATTNGAASALRTYDVTNGLSVGSVDLPGVASDLAPAPDGGWAVRIGYPPKVLRFSDGLDRIVAADVSYGSGLFYDAARSRYLVPGMSSDGSGDKVMTALAEDDLRILQTQSWPSGDLPDALSAYGEDGLLGVSSSGRSRLTSINALTLAPMEHTILGVGLTGMALDEAGNLLFIADDQDRIHLLSLPDGSVREAWVGASPIGLDAANHRLYVNRAGGVVALDTTTGTELARFPQNGMPAPDPNRDLIYITDGGVTTYDRQGRRLGVLEQTFPPNIGMVPNPSAEAALVNPSTGYLAAVMDNGAPGSSNRSYLEIYPPGASVPITVPGFFSFVADIAFDPSGNLYAAYSPANNLEAMQKLDGAGKEIGRLGGRTGALAIDPGSGTVYVAQDGVLTLVDSDTLELKDLRRLPMPVSQLLLHPGLRQLYVRTAREPRIAALDLDELQPFDFRPVEVGGLPPDLDIQAVDFAEIGDDLMLFATTSTGEHYRAYVAPGSDGTGFTWQRLPVGSIPAWGQLTVAGGALFRAGRGAEGADGVFRSLDGGDTWELIDAGLVDLRSAQPVVALHADQAYFVGRTGGVLAWRPDAGRWTTILTPAADHEWQGDLSLAPDGTLFLQSWGRLQRSSDGGETWIDLPVPAESGKIAGFDPDYPQAQTVFALYCSSDACQVTRSLDGMQTQRPVFSLPPYSPPLRLLAGPPNPSAGDAALYLFGGGYVDMRLYRSLDGGVTWQAAGPGDLQGVYSIAVAPDGRLWLGRKGSVQALDPERFSWSPVPPFASPKPGAGTTPEAS